MPLTPDRLAEIKARNEKRTPGAWSLGKPDLKGFDAHMCEVMTAYATKNDPKAIAGCYDIICRTWSPEQTCSSIRFDHTQNQSNAAFIANAPQDITDLLAEVERLQTPGSEANPFEREGMHGLMTFHQKATIEDMGPHPSGDGLLVVVHIPMFTNLFPEHPS